MMVEHYHSTRLEKTTTQLYGLPHAKTKIKYFLLHKIMELYNTDDNYKWAHTLWLDRILTNHMQEGFTDYGSGMVSWEQQNNVGVETTIDWLSDMHLKHKYNLLWFLSLQTLDYTCRLHHMN